jgi:hypothetical protein
MLAAVMQEGWDGLALGKALENKTTSIAQALPLGMTLDKVTDQAVNIFLGRRRVHDEVRDGARRRAAGELAQPRLACRHRRGRGYSAHAGRRVLHHAGDRPLLRPDHARRPDPGARPSRRRRHHRHRGDGREDGGGHGPHQGGGLCLEPHRSADAVGHAGDDRRLPAGRLRASTAGEYAGNIFWVVGFALIVSWIVAVSSRPISASRCCPRSSRSKAVRTPSTTRRTIGACAAAHHLCRAPQVPDLRDRRPRLRALRHRHGRAQAAVLPHLRPARGARRSPLPEGSSIETTTARSKRSSAGSQAVGGQDRHQLCRPGRAALLPGAVARAARSGLRQDRRADARTPMRARR